MKIFVLKHFIIRFDNWAFMWVFECYQYLPIHQAPIHRASSLVIDGESEGSTYNSKAFDANQNPIGEPNNLIVADIAGKNNSRTV